MKLLQLGSRGGSGAQTGCVAGLKEDKSRGLFTFSDGPCLNSCKRFFRYGQLNKFNGSSFWSNSSFLFVYLMI